MKIIKWLHEPMSARVGLALVEVGEGESSDVEEMLKLIDGDSVGHFGVDVKLVGTDNPPEYKKGRNGLYTHGQFGYSCSSDMKKKKRYYEVHVHRD
jgi:hypothetical protein